MSSARCFNAPPPEVCPGPPVHGGPTGPMLHCHGPAVCDCRPGQEVYTLDHRNQDDSQDPRNFRNLGKMWEDVGRCGKMWEGKATNVGLRRFLGWSLSEWLRVANVNRARVSPWRGAWRGDRCVPANFFKKCLVQRWFGSTLEYPNFTNWSMGNKHILNGYPLVMTNIAMENGP